jgi:hypothetical protein
LGRHVAIAGTSLILLPHEAWYTANAILRTLFRLGVTHRRLLDWKTARATEQSTGNSLWDSYRAMWLAPVLAVGAACAAKGLPPGALLAAAPYLLAWALSPAAVWWISRPAPPEPQRLTHSQLLFLQKLARKTWRYFETFVGPRDNWLPPDNFQETPLEDLAHRTSPTNMGLSLLANLSALDFGYITLRQSLERTAASLQTMNGMERFRGHFYNWYDTENLMPLHPRYVSTVDSGNLAGHMLTLRMGLLEIP